MNHSSVHLLPPPRIITQEANAAHVAALEAEIARLRKALRPLAVNTDAADEMTLRTIYVKQRDIDRAWALLEGAG